MHARVVRFTDVTRERIDGIKARIEAENGPPPGVDSTGMKLLYDSDQSTGIFIGYFADEEKMRAADEILRNMGAGETPGSRASIDQCEVVLERDA
jgi:hypothetical protein